MIRDKGKQRDTFREERRIEVTRREMGINALEALREAAKRLGEFGHPKVMESYTHTYSPHLNKERTLLLTALRGTKLSEAETYALASSDDFIVRNTLPLLPLRVLHPVWIRIGLRDKDPDVREAAVRALPKLRGSFDFAKDVIDGKTREEETYIRETAAEAIQRTPEFKRNGLALIEEYLGKEDMSHPALCGILVRALPMFGERAWPVLQRAIEHEYSSVRMEAIGILAKLPNFKERGWPLLIRGLNDGIDDVRIKAIETLPAYSRDADKWNKIKEYLWKIARDTNEDEFVRISILKVLPALKRDVWGLVEEMAKDMDVYVNEALMEVLPALKKFNEKRAWEIVKDRLKSENQLLKSDAVKILPAFKAESSHLLKNIAKNSGDTVRETLLNILPEFNGIGWGIAQTMLTDEVKTIRQKAVRTLIKFGDKGWKLVEILSHSEDIYTQTAAEELLFLKCSKKSDAMWLLTRGPLFATPFLPEIARRLEKIEEITKEVQDMSRKSAEFNEELIGVVIHGSAAKGYLVPSSDIDCIIITKEKNKKSSGEDLDKKITPRTFMRLAKEADLHPEEITKITQQLNQSPVSLRNSTEERNLSIHEESVLGRKETINHLGYLFMGGFFGDKNGLREMQKKALEEINAEDWDGIRLWMIYRETENINQKLYPRFGENIDKEMLKAMIRVLRIPPSYEEMCREFGIAKER